MLITEDYLKLNAELHRENGGYGIQGWQWIGPVLKAMQQSGSRTLLDYGCGKALLSEWFPTEFPAVVNYDPVTFPEDPPVCDFVCVLDVMEHIEPECLPEVLGHIRSKMLKGGLFVISTRLAGKTLKDGRNAHLIVGDKAYWDPKLRQFFSVVERLDIGRGDELVRFVRP